jgi:hypothetical protein
MKIDIIIILRMTSIIPAAAEYKVVYDGQINQVRDLTWEELKKTHGRGSKITCQCLKREYVVGPNFISQHMQTQKHLGWLEKEQDAYVKEYGHCVSSEEKVDILYKKQREQKVMYHNLSIAKKILDDKFVNLEEENKLLREENDLQKKGLLIMNNKIDSSNKIICKKFTEEKKLKNELVLIHEMNEDLKNELNTKKIEIMIILKEFKILERKLNNPKKKNVVEIIQRLDKKKSRAWYN